MIRKNSRLYTVGKCMSIITALPLLFAGCSHKLDPSLPKEAATAIQKMDQARGVQLDIYMNPSKADSFLRKSNDDNDAHTIQASAVIMHGTQDEIIGSDCNQSSYDGFQKSLTTIVERVSKDHQPKEEYFTIIHTRTPKKDSKDEPINLDHWSEQSAEPFYDTVATVVAKYGGSESRKLPTAAMSLAYTDDSQSKIRLHIKLDTLVQGIKNDQAAVDFEVKGPEKKYKVNEAYAVQLLLREWFDAQSEQCFERYTPDDAGKEKANALLGKTYASAQPLDAKATESEIEKSAVGKSLETLEELHLRKVKSTDNQLTYLADTDKNMDSKVGELVRQIEQLRSKQTTPTVYAITETSTESGKQLKLYELSDSTAPHVSFKEITGDVIKSVRLNGATYPHTLGVESILGLYVADDTSVPVPHDVNVVKEEIQRQIIDLVFPYMDESVFGTVQGQMTEAVNGSVSLERFFDDMQLRNGKSGEYVIAQALDGFFAVDAETIRNDIVYNNQATKHLRDAAIAKPKDPTSSDLKYTATSKKPEPEQAKSGQDAGAEKGDKVVVEEFTNPDAMTTYLNTIVQQTKDIYKGQFGKGLTDEQWEKAWSNYHCNVERNEIAINKDKTVMKTQYTLTIQPEGDPTFRPTPHAFTYMKDLPLSAALLLDRADHISGTFDLNDPLMMLSQEKLIELLR